VSDLVTRQHRARKRSRVVWLGLAGIGAGTVILAEVVSSREDPVAADLFQSTAECVASGRYDANACDRAFNEAARQQPQTAPRYATREDCAAEFDRAACAPVSAPGTAAAGASQFFAPAMAGFLIGSAAGALSSSAVPVYQSCGSGSNPANCQASGGGGGSSGGRFYTGSGYSVMANGTRASVMPAAFSASPATATLSRGGFGARASSVRAAS